MTTLAAPKAWHKVTADELLADLRRVQAELGYVSQAAYEAYGHHAKKTVVRTFGSFRQACRLAGAVMRSNGARLLDPAPRTTAGLCMDCRQPFPRRIDDASHRCCDRCRDLVHKIESIPEGFEYCC